MAADLTATDEPTPEQPRRRRSLRWGALALGVVLVAFFVVLAGAEESSTRAADSRLTGKPAPEVIADTIDGTRYRLNSDRGKWVLVNFFATWCVPCRIEHPELIRFQQRHAAIGDATVLGIVFGDTPEAVREYRQKEGGDWPMLIDEDGAISVDFGVRGVPESFLVAPDGTVVSKIVGGVKAESLEDLLRRAKAGG